MQPNPKRIVDFGTGMVIHEKDPVFHVQAIREDGSGEFLEVGFSAVPALQMIVKTVLANPRFQSRGGTA